MKYKIHGSIFNEIYLIIKNDQDDDEDFDVVYDYNHSKLKGNDEFNENHILIEPNIEESNQEEKIFDQYI